MQPAGTADPAAGRVLALACGNQKTPGAVGVDIRPGPLVDVVHDLDVFPYPFGDDEFDAVEFVHGIEHLRNPRATMDEIHRVARDGARVHIVTPHYSSQSSYGDMTHYHHFGRVTFTHLCEGGAFELVEDRLEFTDLYRALGIAWLANRFPRRWEKYWAFRFPALYVHVVLRVRKGPKA